MLCRLAIVFETENIKENRYKTLIERQIYVNFGFEEGKKFIEKWNIVVYPLEASIDFVDFFDHVEGETNLGIAWGVTMPKSDDSGGDIFCFINDKANMFILRSNFTKISHEIGHGLMYALRGRGRCVREYADPAARAGTEAACYVTLVHDQFYGRMKFRTYWIRYIGIWLPVQMLDIYDILDR